MFCFVVVVREQDVGEVDRAPNDDDFKRLNEAFINFLQSINVPGGTINLSGILLSDTNHEAKNRVGLMFERMAIPLPTYDDIIATDSNNAVRAKAKRLWTAKIELQRLIKKRSSAPGARSSSLSWRTPGSSP